VISIRVGRLMTATPKARYLKPPNARAGRTQLLIGAILVSDHRSSGSRPVLALCSHEAWRRNNDYEHDARPPAEICVVTYLFDNVSDVVTDIAGCAVCFSAPASQCVPRSGL